MSKATRQTASYPCGKQIDMSLRDATNWDKMHKKVCKRCKEALALRTTIHRSDPRSEISISKHNGLLKESTKVKEIKKTFNMQSKGAMTIQSVETTYKA